MTIEQDKLIKQLAETQAQLKEAREALEEISHGDDTAPETMRRIAKNVLSRLADYKALDAAIEPYRLDAERFVAWFGEDLPDPRPFMHDVENPSLDDWRQAIDAAIARKG